MRLTAAQQRIIQETVRATVGDDATVVVFGSRLDDARRGGDVDLLIETNQPVPVLDRARLGLRLQQRLGLPFDLVFHCRGTPWTPFQKMAWDTGTALVHRSSP
ncbi:MAG: nucleotidyltransferase domain-containing protein [Tepidimonas ignava]|uniref:nucleotidyltransferase domain-containing protein n=1 Tax=Tepidimonas ignava TaxID=114249 RepID=UPI003918FE79